MRRSRSCRSSSLSAVLTDNTAETRLLVAAGTSLCGGQQEEGLPHMHIPTSSPTSNSLQKSVQRQQPRTVQAEHSLQWHTLQTLYGNTHHTLSQKNYYSVTPDL